MSNIDCKELIPLSDIERMGKIISASGLFGLSSPEQAAALMLVAQAEGRHPASVAMDFNIIQGRPALKADAMLARFLDSGGKVQWKEYTDEKVTAVFSHPQGGTVEITWDDARVKKAALNNPNHTKYPRQMKRARCISEGIRTVYPAVCCGIYTPEEVIDMEPVDQNITIVNTDHSVINSQKPTLTTDRRAIGIKFFAKYNNDKQVASNELFKITGKKTMADLTDDDLLIVKRVIDAEETTEAKE